MILDGVDKKTLFWFLMKSLCEVRRENRENDGIDKTVCFFCDCCGSLLINFRQGKAHCKYTLNYLKLCQPYSFIVSLDKIEKVIF